MGILEGITEQLRQFQETVSDLTAEVRASAPKYVPLTEDEEVMCDGALTVKQATAFCRISRGSLYEAMRSDGLPKVAIKGCRLIPKRALIRWMAKHQEQAILPTNGGAGARTYPAPCRRTLKRPGQTTRWICFRMQGKVDGGSGRCSRNTTLRNQKISPTLC